jgi:HEAT repeat protein
VTTAAHQPAPAFLRLLALGLAMLLQAGPAGAEGPAPDRELLTAFQNGRYDQVIRLYASLPQGRPPSKDVLRAALRSYLRLGQPEAALPIYVTLTPPGQSDDPSTLRDLARAFISSHARDPEEYVRIAAFTSLAETGDRQAIPLLEDGLLDPSILVRARAIEGLGRTAVQAKRSGQPAPTAPLKRALQDPAPPVRIAALDALGDVGDRNDADLLETLTKIARADEGPAQVFALAALVKLGRAQAFDEIMGAATLPNPDLRMAAIGVLGRLKRRSSLTLLTQSVYDPDESVRTFAAGALGDFADPAGVGALTHALGDDSPRVRGTAAVSLGRLGLAHSKPLLRHATRDPVELVRAGAVEGLLRLGDREAVLLAADLAKHDSPSIRGAAAQAVGLAGNSQALPVLEGLLADQQPQPRLMAVRALGKIGDRKAIPLLKKALGDKDPAIRVTAAGSLLQLLKAQERATR